MSRVTLVASCPVAKAMRAPHVPSFNRNISVQYKMIVVVAGVGAGNGGGGGEAEEIEMVDVLFGRSDGWWGSS